MKKILKTALIGMALSTLMSTTVFAGQWKQDANGWWWQNSNGSYPKEEWLLDGGKWYYFDEEGYMLESEWQLYNGEWFYLNYDGSMLSDDKYAIEEASGTSAYIFDKKGAATPYFRTAYRKSTYVNDDLDYLLPYYSDYKNHYYVISFSDNSQLVDEGEYYVVTECILKDYMKSRDDPKHLIKEDITLYWDKNSTIRWVTGNTDSAKIYNSSLIESWETMKHLIISSNSNLVQDDDGYITYVKFDNRAG